MIDSQSQNPQNSTTIPTVLFNQIDQSCPQSESDLGILVFPKSLMYLLDTNVVSEQRKQTHANPGVQRFFQQAAEEGVRGFISVITVGELRRGVELIRHRGDTVQAETLEAWLQALLESYADNILDFTAEEAQVWGRLRIPHYEHALDKQIAATALTHGLTLVTRNVSDFAGSGVPLFNPFTDMP